MSNDKVKNTGRTPDSIWLGIDLGGTTAKLALFRSSNAEPQDTESASGIRKAGKIESADNIHSTGNSRFVASAIQRPVLLRRMVIPSRTEDGGSHVISDIAAAAQKLAEEEGLSLREIAGAGIGVPGPVLEETDQGYPVVGCVNLNLKGIHYMDRELQALTGIPRIAVCNDANAATLGELYFGSDNDTELPTNAVMVTLGTGIGGGIINSGRIITGAFGAAGEIGHMPISPGQPLLRQIHEVVPELKLTADLEYYASATGIARMAKAALRAVEAASDFNRTSDPETTPDFNRTFDPEATPDFNRTFDPEAAHVSNSAAGRAAAIACESGFDPVLCRGSMLRSIGEIEARHVFDAAKNGDPLGLAVTSFFFDVLGQGLAAIASVTDPQIFIIGGGVSAAGDFLLDGLRKSYRQKVFHASRETAFRLATLGNDAGLLGPLVPLLRG